MHKPYLGLKAQGNALLVLDQQELAGDLAVLLTGDRALKARGLGIPLLTDTEVLCRRRIPPGETPRLLPLDKPPCRPRPREAEAVLAAGAKHVVIRDGYYHTFPIPTLALLAYAHPAPEPYHTYARFDPSSRGSLAEAAYALPAGKPGPAERFLRELFPGRSVRAHVEAVHLYAPPTRLVLIEYLEPGGPLTLALPLRVEQNLADWPRFPCDPVLFLHADGTTELSDRCRAPFTAAGVLWVPEALAREIVKEGELPFAAEFPEDEDPRTPERVHLTGPGNKTLVTRVLWPEHLKQVLLSRSGGASHA